MMQKYEKYLYKIVFFVDLFILNDECLYFETLTSRAVREPHCITSVQVAPQCENDELRIRSVPPEGGQAGWTSWADKWLLSFASLPQ
jgi:hypothetical protein